MTPHDLGLDYDGGTPRQRIEAIRLIVKWLHELARGSGTDCRAYVSLHGASPEMMAAAEELGGRRVKHMDLIDFFDEALHVFGTKDPFDEMERSAP